MTGTAVILDTNIYLHPWLDCDTVPGTFDATRFVEKHFRSSFVRLFLLIFLL